MRPKLFRRVSVTMGPPLRWDAVGGPDLVKRPASVAGPEPGAGAESVPGETVPETGDLRRFTDQLMDAIASMSGQERVDQYASRDHGRLATSGSRARSRRPKGPAPRPATI